MDAPLTIKAREDRTYDYTDLLRAYIDSIKYGPSAATELASYYTSFFEALCAIFEVNFDTNGKGEMMFLIVLFGRLAIAHNEVKSPWSGIYSTSRGAGDFMEYYTPKFEAAQAALRTEVFNAMCDLYVRCFADPEKTATSADLRRLGIDDRNPPSFLEALQRELD